MKDLKIKISAILLAGMTMLAYNGCGASMEKADGDYVSVADITRSDAVMNGFADADADAPAVVPEVAPEAVPADGAVPAYDGFADDAEYARDAGDAVAEFAGDAPMADIADDIALEVPVEVFPEEEIPVAPEIPEADSRIGMLTAGEWRDHENWGFFENLVNTGLIQFPDLGVDPTRRIAVTVTDPSGNPLPNVDVTLEQDGTGILWQSVTDKNGVAYLFGDSANAETSSMYLTIHQGDAVQTLTLEDENLPEDEQGNVMTSSREYAVTLETEQKLYPETEIMFLVDTTGSMGDEMLFLQSDFSAIAEETGDEYTRYSVNFYKDEGDEYVTKCSGFTGDVQAIRNQLCAESASGGGDEPEAVAQIFQETLSGDMWGQDTVKIAFLIYDAPPHAGTEEVLCQAIRDASAKGIHLIPVVSSNGSRETELFGRACAICTNGSYVFLTDDSGIGGSHLEPIIGDYEVESLHDIIVRIIQEYKQS